MSYRSDYFPAKRLAQELMRRFCREWEYKIDNKIIFTDQQVVGALREFVQDAIQLAENCHAGLWRELDASEDYAGHPE